VWSRKIFFFTEENLQIKEKVSKGFKKGARIYSSVVYTIRQEKKNKENCGGNY
jgi:hypothetical protein